MVDHQPGEESESAHLTESKCVFNGTSECALKDVKQILTKLRVQRHNDHEQMREVREVLFEEGGLKQTIIELRFEMRIVRWVGILVGTCVILGVCGLVGKAILGG
jgi:hypothetical protein